MTMLDLGDHVPHKTDAAHCFSKHFLALGSMGQIKHRTFSTPVNIAFLISA
jgi:hypothetical protein